MPPGVDPMMPHCKVCKDLDLHSELHLHHNVHVDIPFNELESSVRGGTCNSCCLLFDTITNSIGLNAGKGVDAVRLTLLESLAVQLRFGDNSGFSDLFYLHVLPGKRNYVPPATFSTTPVSRSVVQIIRIYPPPFEH